MVSVAKMFLDIENRIPCTYKTAVASLARFRVAVVVFQDMLIMSVVCDGRTAVPCQGVR
jgi:hypothetical protein